MTSLNYILMYIIVKMLLTVYVIVEIIKRNFYTRGNIFLREYLHLQESYLSVVRMETNLCLLKMCTYFITMVQKSLL